MNLYEAVVAVIGLFFVYSLTISAMKSHEKCVEMRCKRKPFGPADVVTTRPNAGGCIVTNYSEES